MVFFLFFFSQHIATEIPSQNSSISAFIAALRINLMSSTEFSILSSFASMVSTRFAIFVTARARFTVTSSFVSTSISKARKQQLIEASSGDSSN
eukprot:m.51991 g.51991  ORF g.51991 m.51991 type:complete len:94 (+) comp7593_c0_seq1:228-509(+)